MEILRTLIFFIGGFVAALYASSVGGMAFIVLPLLLFFGLPIKTAIATGRLVAVAMSGVALLKYSTHEKIHFKAAIPLAILSAITSYFGTFALKYLTDEEMKFLAIGSMTIAILMNTFSGKIQFKGKKNIAIVIIYTSLVGIYAGAFGMGAGAILIFAPIMLGYTFRESIGINQSAILLSCIVTSLVFFKDGFIDLEFAAPLILGVSAGSWVGISWSLKKGDKYIKILIYIVLAASIIHLLFFI